MTESEEVAGIIIKSYGAKPKTVEEARLLTTRYVGTPTAIGHQAHANITEALLK